ncbi:MAG: CRISPR-associated endonuclease Cas2 [Candidatus Daviesbacteria bacterium]|nr:CRISPR-associated endonuclease Cas2 [Candidatus Daviesbacteria bacterium]
MNKKNSWSKFVLLALEKTIDGYIRMEDFLNNPHYYAYSGGWQYPLKKDVLAQTLKRLRENGLIDFVDDKTLAFKLTDSGKDKALWMKMTEIEEKWDGKWRLVIWDIPEKRRTVRNILRNKLKQLGFQQFQKSVWGSKKDCTKVLRDFIKQVGVQDWVMVIESDDIK